MSAFASAAEATVVITSSFPIRGDGSEAAGAFVADLVEELAQHAPVRVVAPGPRDERERYAPNVEVIRYAAPAIPLSTLKPWRPGDLYWMARVLRGGMHAARTAIGAGRPRVLALWGLPCGEWARRAALRRGLPYTVWLLGSDVWSLGRVPVLRSMLARVIRQAGKAYADGYLLADDARRISGTPVEFLPSTRSIGTAGDPPAPRVAAPYRLLFLGRWHPNKGVDLLLRALGLLGDTDWGRIEQVEIQGGGPLEPVVRESVEALRRAGRPVLLGAFLPKDQAEAAIARADWLLIPSRIESVPVVFSDAMKLGRPVVAMPVGDLPRLVDELRCGVVAQAVSAEDYARALASALAAPTARFLPGAAAARFDLRAIARTLLHEGDVRT
jgi:glycosyltransferase involved in cell wall biosynthesis